MTSFRRQQLEEPRTADSGPSPSPAYIFKVDPALVWYVAADHGVRDLIQRVKAGGQPLSPDVATAAVLAAAAITPLLLPTRPGPLSVEAFNAWPRQVVVPKLVTLLKAWASRQTGRLFSRSLEDEQSVFQQLSQLLSLAINKSPALGAEVMQLLDQQNHLRVAYDELHDINLRGDWPPPPSPAEGMSPEELLAHIGAQFAHYQNQWYLAELLNV